MIITNPKKYLAGKNKKGIFFIIAIDQKETQYEIIFCEGDGERLRASRGLHVFREEEIDIVKNWESTTNLEEFFHYYL